MLFRSRELPKTYVLQELAHALSLAQPDLVIVDRTLVRELRAAIDQSKALSPERSPSLRLWDEIDIAAILTTETASKIPLQAEHSAESTAFVCFSSGTTGPVKGVRLSHRNMVANMFQHRQGLQGDFDEHSVFVLVLPFFHILGLGVFACQYMLQVSTDEGPNPQYLLKCLGVSHCCVPTP